MSSVPGDARAVAAYIPCTDFDCERGHPHPVDLSRDVVEFVENDAGEWHWRHLDVNGEQLARSSETYADKRDMMHAASRTLGEERLRGMEVKTLGSETRQADAEAAIEAEVAQTDYDDSVDLAGVFEDAANGTDTPDGAPPGE